MSKGPVSYAQHLTGAGDRQCCLGDSKRHLVLPVPPQCLLYVISAMSWMLVSPAHKFMCRTLNPNVMGLGSRGTLEVLGHEGGAP